MRAIPGVFYACQSGKAALDRDREGGNPFASALVELLGRPVLTVATLRSDLVALTLAKSRGFQDPDVSSGAHAPDWQVKPLPRRSRRVALVFVYSAYPGGGTPSLPGARRDLLRVRDSLRNAGFDVVTLVDPARTELARELHTISVTSRGADAAVIYATGHSFEHRGEVFLLPNDHSLGEDVGRSTEFSVHVATLSDHLNAARANLVFFGGCRTRR